MKLISHRGNLFGSSGETENTNKQIKKCISEGYEVEIDLWCKNGSLYLGHDAPNEKFILEEYDSDKLWIHCKNLECLHYFSNNIKKYNYFFHDKDDATITSNGFLWIHPNADNIVGRKTVLVLPEKSSKIFHKENIFGICSDYVGLYKTHYKLDNQEKEYIVSRELSMKQKVSFVTGTGGQAAYYLIKLLLSKGHKVVGMMRRNANKNVENIKEFLNHPDFILEEGNMQDGASLWNLLSKYHPDEIYNLAAQSHVHTSFSVSEETVDVVGLGTLRLLNAFREICPEARFIQASSSEMFGENTEAPQNEHSKMLPASPYACAKLFAHNICRNYRASYGLHISSMIMFNHECLTENTPVFVKDIRTGLIDVKAINEIVPHRKDPTKGKKYSTTLPCDYLVWDGGKWSKILTRTATWNDSKNDK